MKNENFILCKDLKIMTRYNNFRFLMTSVKSNATKSLFDSHNRIYSNSH